MAVERDRSKVNAPPCSDMWFAVFNLCFCGLTDYRTDTCPLCWLHAPSHLQLLAACTFTPHLYMAIVPWCNTSSVMKQETVWWSQSCCEKSSNLSRDVRSGWRKSLWMWCFTARVEMKCVFTICINSGKNNYSALQETMVSFVFLFF